MLKRIAIMFALVTGALFAGLDTNNGVRAEEEETMFYALILLENDGTPGTPNFRQAGVVTGWYPAAGDGTRLTGKNKDIPAGFGSGWATSAQAWIRFPDTTDPIRAGMMANGGNAGIRRFYFDLPAIQNALPPGQARKWFGDTIDPNKEMSVGEIKQRTVDWSLAVGFVVDQTTGTTAVEQDIIDAGTWTDD